MAQESSDKPNDPVPENSTSPINESASTRREATPESPLPADFDNLLNHAEDSLTEVDDQLTNPSQSDREESLPSDTQETELASDVQNSPPAPKPPIQQDKKINQTLDDLEQDMQSLTQQVGENAEDAVHDNPNAVDDIVSQLPDIAGVESDEEDTSPVDSQDTDSTEEPPPAENIDDMLSSLADEMQDVKQDEQVSKTNFAQPSDTSTPETAAEDEQVANDEIDTVLARTASPDPETHEQTHNDRQQDQSAPADDQPPAKEKTATPDQDQEEEEDFTTISQPSSDPPKAIPVSADENPEKLARAEAKPEETTVEITPEDWAKFSLPLRLCIKTIFGINKPFRKIVPERIKDLLGIVAVVTVLLSVITAALILFMLD